MLTIGSRVIARETEYGTILIDKNGNTRTPNDYRVQGCLFTLASDRTCTGLAPHVRGVFSNLRACLPDGRMIYIDAGCHPECADQECRGPREATLYHLAGERIMSGIFGIPHGDGSRIQLVKGTVGVSENGFPVSWGHHENYEIFGFSPRDKELPDLLIPFLAGRQIISGSGCWISDHYCFSPRVFHMETDVGTGATSGRAILHARDEPHTGELKDTIKRLHLAIGDGIRCPYQIWLTLGITSLMLSLIEAHVLPPLGYPKADNQFSKPQIVTEIKQVSYDFENRGRSLIITLGDRSLVSAYELMVRYFEIVRQYMRRARFESEEVRSETYEIMQGWEETLSAIYSNDLEWLTGRFDWATQYVVADASVKRRGIIGEGALQKLHSDFAALYCCLPIPNSGYQTIFEKVGKFYASRMLFSEDEIQKAIDTPPQKTRAKIRAAVVAKALALADHHRMKIDWDTIAVYGGSTLRISDPLGYQNNALDYFLLCVS